MAYKFKDAKLGQAVEQHKQRRKRSDMGSATVDMFLNVLAHNLIRYDMKESKRERSPNIYRLGLLLAAAGEVRGDVAFVLECDDVDAMAKLKASLSKHFNEGFPPLTNVLKQIDNWTELRKYPTLV